MVDLIQWSLSTRDKLWWISYSGASLQGTSYNLQLPYRIVCWHGSGYECAASSSSSPPPPSRHFLASAVIPDAPLHLKLSHCKKQQQRNQWQWSLSTRDKLRSEAFTFLQGRNELAWRPTHQPSSLQGRTKGACTDPNTFVTVMYVYVRTCMHACSMYVHVCAYTHTYVRTYIHMRISTEKEGCLCVHMYVRTYVHNVCAFGGMFVCAHVRMYICVCIRTEKGEEEG